MAVVLDWLSRRRRHPLRDRLGVLPGPRHRGVGHGRREDAGDDRRGAGLAADAADARFRVIRRIRDRRRTYRVRPGRDAGRAAVRNVSRPRGVGGGDCGRPHPHLVPWVLSMNQYGYALLGLTAIVAMLVAVLTYAVLKFVVGARQARNRLQPGSG